MSRLVSVSGSTTTQASKHRIEGWVGRGVRSVSQRSISLRQACPRQVKGKSKASNRIYVGDIRIRIFGRAILRCLIRQVARSVSASCMRVGIVVGVGSRKVGALVLNDLLKYIVQDGLRVVWVLYVLGDTKDVAALADIVFYIFVGALVRELSHFDFFRGELFIEIKEVEGGRRQVFDAGKKNSCLQLRHGSLKLRWN